MNTNNEILKKWDNVINKWSQEQNEIREVMKEWLQPNNHLSLYLQNASYKKKNFNNYFMEINIKQNAFGMDMNVLIDRHWQKGFVTNITIFLKDDYYKQFNLNSEIKMKLYSDEYPSPEKIFNTFQALHASYTELNDCDDQIIKLWKK